MKMQYQIYAKLASLNIKGVPLPAHLLFQEYQVIILHSCKVSLSSFNAVTAMLATAMLTRSEKNGYPGSSPGQAYQFRNDVAVSFVAI